MGQQILTAATSNDDTSTTFQVDPEKGASLQIGGNFNNATVELEGSLDDGTTWTVVEGYTAVVFKKIEAGPEAKFRLKLSSVGGSTSINAWISA